MSGLTNTSFSWTLVIQGGRSTPNAAGLFHSCASSSQSFFTNVFPFQAGHVDSASEEPDSWAVFYLDSKNMLWIGSTGSNGPDATDTLTVTYDPSLSQGQVSFAFTLNPDKNFSITCKQYTSLA